MNAFSLTLITESLRPGRTFTQWLPGLRGCKTNSRKLGIGYDRATRKTPITMNPIPTSFCTDRDSPKSIHAATAFTT